MLLDFIQLGMAAGKVANRNKNERINGRRCVSQLERDWERSKKVDNGTNSSIVINQGSDSVSGGQVTITINVNA